jgi:hypothetical protein
MAHTLYVSGSGRAAGRLQPFRRGLLEKSEWSLDVDGRNFLRYAATGQQCLRRPTSSRCDALLTKWASLLQSCLSYTLVYFRQSRDSSVGVATRYRQDGPGIEVPVEGEIFRTCQYRPWDPPGRLYNGYRVFPGGKATGAWR